MKSDSKARRQLQSEEVPVAKKLSAKTLENLKAIYGECKDGVPGCMEIPLRM